MNAHELAVHAHAELGGLLAQSDIPEHQKARIGRLHVRHQAYLDANPKGPAAPAEAVDLAPPVTAAAVTETDTEASG